MKTRTSIININGIDIELSRKSMKNLRLSIHPPDGKVKLSVPKRISKVETEKFILSKMDWLKEKLKKYENATPQKEKEYISGEEHMLFGEIYFLKIVEGKGKQRAELEDGNRINLFVKAGGNLEIRKKILDEFYREKLKNEISTYITKWESLMNLKVNEWNVKRMKTKWGTCNIIYKRIWLNLELAKKTKKCLEYVVVHEMVHLIEKNHNKRFYSFLDKYFPDWKKVKEELNFG